MPDKHCDTLIIGAGAAGLMAGIQAARRGRRVLILEKMDRPGRKLLITGKGRCNVTNCCTVEEFMGNVLTNRRFLYSCLNALNPYEVMGFFEECGIPLKVERGERVFPVSDHASDIVDALVQQAKDSGCRITQACAHSLLLEADEGGRSRVCGIVTEDGQEIRSDAVIVATGGKSYPMTGSTGDGYRLARQAGHRVTPLRPSLIPIVCEEKLCRDMMGLSLKNVTLTVVDTASGKEVFSELGEMLFTHFGVSGPLMLSASAHLRRWDKEQYTLSIDLKPALDEQKLDARILRDVGENPNRDMANILSGLVHRSMVPVLLRRLALPEGEKANSLTKEQRRRLVQELKHFTVSLTGPRPVAEAIVTAGGIKVGEVVPNTMASKLVEGLYFAGEVLDVDAYTGGFNLQIAWATGYLAGLSAAEK